MFCPFSWLILLWYTAYQFDFCLNINKTIYCHHLKGSCEEILMIQSFFFFHSYPDQILSIIFSHGFLLCSTVVYSRSVLWGIKKWNTFSDSFTILGLWVPGLAVSHINVSQLQTYESRTLFFMTSLQYHCILGLSEIKTLHPREKIMSKRCRMRR